MLYFVVSATVQVQTAVLALAFNYTVKIELWLHCQDELLWVFTMLTQDKKTLRESTPDNSVAHLQEELIAVKLREAEANLSLKDLRQRVGELGQQWQRHLQVSA